MTEPTITISPVDTIPACEDLQRVHNRIWSGGTGIEIIPTHILITVAKNGLLLGAYASDGPPETNGMIGFVMGWLATIPESEGQATPPVLKHCSHIAGVLPDYQGRGVGLKLKLAQREAVLAQGLVDHATWTYDPLYWVNGRMNIHRLGAVCTTYKRNVYGEIDDDLNAGAPTDRCLVDWFLNSPRVHHAISPNRQDEAWDFAAMHLLPTENTASGLPKPIGSQIPLDGTPIALPLPNDVSAIRQRDQALLVDWRYFTRDVFEATFGAGYALVDCVRIEDRGWHYILTSPPTDDREAPSWP